MKKRVDEDDSHRGTPLISPTSSTTINPKLLTSNDLSPNVKVNSIHIF